MDWNTFVLAGIGTTIVNLLMGESVAALVWLALLYGCLQSTYSWEVVYLVFVTWMLLKKSMRGLPSILPK